MAFEFAAGKVFVWVLAGFLLIATIIARLIWIAFRAAQSSSAQAGANVDDPVYRETLRQHRFSVWTANRPVIAAHIQALSAYATIAINAVILANSAAAGAVLTLIGSLWSNKDRPLVMPEAIEALKIFGAGVAFGILGAAISYLCQLAYGKGDLDDDTDAYKYYFAGYILRIFGMLVVTCGVIAFAIGGWQGLDALDAVKYITP